jgi:hypothetical protein
MNEPIIIEVGGKATAMYLGGKLWLSLTRLKKSLGAIRLAGLLTCETCILNKRDGGIYVPFDDVAEMVPELKDHWEETKIHYMKNVKEAQL